MTQEEFVKRYTYNPTNDLLGEGGFGRVYRAYDRYEHEYVALKIQSVDPHYPDLRLRNEVEKVQCHLHKNIARYKGCYTFTDYRGETDIAVMKYYESGSLDKLMASGRLSIEERCALLQEILEGIAYLHNEGIIHRDLKPQNVLIVEFGGVYSPLITDFGISKQLAEGESSAVSNSVLGGTRAYASPEQLKESTIRKNTDLWSFGVIAYQMLAGELPFNSGTFSPTSEEGRQEQFRQMMSGVLPEKLRSIPEPWQRLIRECLVVDATKRLAHAEDCIAIIEGRGVDKVADDKTQIDATIAEPIISENKPIVEPQREPRPEPRPSKPEGDEPKKSKWWLWLLLAVVGVICGIALMGGDEEENPLTADTHYVAPAEEFTESADSVAIDSPEPVKLPDPILTLTSESGDTLDADGGSGEIAYALTNPRDDMQLSVKSNANWVSVSRSGDTLSYNAIANNGESSRSAKITVTYGDQSFEVVVTQAGKPKPVVPEVNTYKIGDYYNENGKQGVVFEVSDDGRHGKIVSLDETQVAWDSRVTWNRDDGYGNGTRTYADSKSDGKANTNKVMSRSDSKYFEPFTWCRAMGNSWYLPALNELKSIYNNKSTLNATLQKYGTSLKDELYWTSTEYVNYKPEFCAWGVGVGSGDTYSYVKYGLNYVRAVSAF